jgi:hypothetical protein
MNNKNNLFWIFMGLLLIVALYCYCTKKSSETYKKSSQISNEGNFNLIQSEQPNNNIDNFNLIDAEEDEYHNLQFGMGPGDYGSGRHTSEMVGN